MSRRAKIVVLGGILAVALLVVADFVARAVTTSAVATSVRQRTGAEQVDVRLRTVSALWSLLASQFAAVEVDAFRPQRDGYTVDEVALALDSVSYGTGSTGVSELAGSSGTAIVRVTEEQLNAGLQRIGAPLAIHLVDNGVEISGDFPRIGQASATAAIDVRDGALLLDFSKVQVAGRTLDVPAAVPELRIPLPSVPPDTHMQAYFVVGGRLEVRVGFGAFRVVDGEFAAT